MRKIDSIIIHCSATKAGQDLTAMDIDRWHRQRGFNCIGYHYVIRLNGTIEKGRDISLPGAHCIGWNERSIGICYIGGLDINGKPADTRTNEQKQVLYQLIVDLQREYKILHILGHRDTSPDTNGNGVIEPCEYVKACPCFSVREFLLKERGILCLFILFLCIPVFFSGCRSHKETISNRSNASIDSTSLIIHKGNTVEQSLVSISDSEIVNEHVEDYLWVFPIDTLSLHSVMLRKSVADRKIVRENQVVSKNAMSNQNSLSSKSEFETARMIETEKESLVKSDSWWLKLGLLLCLPVVGYLFYRLIRFFSLFTRA